MLGRPALSQVLDHLTAQAAIHLSKTATLAASAIPPLGRLGQVADVGGVAAELPADGSLVPPEPTTDLRLGKAVSGELEDLHAFMLGEMDFGRHPTLFSL